MHNINSIRADQIYPLVRPRLELSDSDLIDAIKGVVTPVTLIGTKRVVVGRDLISTLSKQGAE